MQPVSIGVITRGLRIDARHLQSYLIVALWLLGRCSREVFQRGDPFLSRGDSSAVGAIS